MAETEGPVPNEVMHNLQIFKMQAMQNMLRAYEPEHHLSVLQHIAVRAGELMRKPLVIDCTSGSTTIMSTGEAENTATAELGFTIEESKRIHLGFGPDLLNNILAVGIEPYRKNSNYTFRLGFVPSYISNTDLISAVQAYQGAIEAGIFDRVLERADQSHPEINKPRILAAPNLPQFGRIIIGSLSNLLSGELVDYQVPEPRSRLSLYLNALLSEQALKNGRGLWLPYREEIYRSAAS